VRGLFAGPWFGRADDREAGASRGRLEYYDARVAAGAEDYYAGRGESPGQWRGRGARAIGLTPGAEVGRSEFLALVRGLNPRDGSVLRSLGARSTVAGFDLTFSAPKSVSVLFAIDDETVASALLASHERAVSVALAYLEREGCWTRRGRDGLERVRGEGFVAASYRHRMSRAGDPQLHTHVVVANMTRADGRHTALDARALYEHKSAAGAVYRAVLRAEVRKRLGWASWRPAGRGLFEVDSIENGVLRHFSQRRVEIEQRAAELVGVGGVEELSRERMEGIALATRRAKSYGVDGATWREAAQARAAEHGLGESELAGLRMRRVADSAGVDRAGVWAGLSGPEGLTATHNSFVRRHALAEIAGTFAQGASLAEIEAATDTYLLDESVMRLSVVDGEEQRHTTQDLLACEREIIDGAQRRRTERTGVLPPVLVDQAIAEQAVALNDDQAAAVRTITSSGYGIDAVSALAGTGKTTTITALARAYEGAGWRVVGAAPTARAARQLRDIAAVKAITMHSLLASIDRGDGLGDRTVLVIDEAGMAPTRLTARLLAHAEQAGAKVIAVGDPGQLGSVQAGGWLAALTRQQAGPALREVMRQRDPAEQDALQALRDGDPDQYLEHKHDEITVHETEVDAITTLTVAWHDAQLEHGRREAVMIARDNLTRERLNRAARTQLKQDGQLDEPDVIIGGRGYTPDDRVIARRNDRRRDVDNGMLATVIAIDPDTGSMLLEADNGEPLALDHEYIALHLEHAYALTAHGAQGGTFQWAGVTGRPDEFAREWGYTALSRARDTTTIHLISQRSERDRERDDYAPAEPNPEPQQTRERLRRALTRTETEPLAYEQISDRPPPRRAPEMLEPSGVDLLRAGRLGRGGRSLGR
jgi:conjugative relaxase-like TrwC/TraI family protein